MIALLCRMCYVLEFYSAKDTLQIVEMSISILIWFMYRDGLLSIVSR